MELIVGTYGSKLLLLELGVATFDVLGTSMFDAENTCTVYQNGEPQEPIVIGRE